MKRFAIAVMVLGGAGACAASAPEYVYVLPEEASAAPRAPATETVPRATATTRPARDPGAIDQSNPIAALRSFAAVYRARRWDLVMKFIPTAELEVDGKTLTEEKLRDAWEGEMREHVERVVTGIEGWLATGRPPEILGETAVAYYGEGKSVSLVREGDAWKVRDFD